MCLAIVVGILQVLILIVFQSQITAIFTNQEGISKQMFLTWTLFMIYVFFDTLQGVAVAAIKASGKQRLGAFVTSSAYWLFGIPSGSILVFKLNWGIEGIWVGMCVIGVYNTVMYLLMVSYCLNWDNIIT
jgi:MATE family multidrug resistance protein